MKDDVLLTAVRDGKSRGRYWLVGMNWAPREKSPVSLFPLQHKRAPRSRTSDIHVNTVIGKKDSRGIRTQVEGHGHLSVGHRHHKLYSMALAFCQKTRNGYGIYQLSSTDYVFLASINGLPAVTADETGSLIRMQELLDLFLIMNETPENGWEIRSGIDTPLNKEELIGNLSGRDRYFCRVSVTGLRQQRLLTAAGFILAAAIGVAILQHEQPAEQPVLTAEQIQARARAMFAKPVPVPALPHPWATMVSIRDLLSLCADYQSRAPYMMVGWKLASGTCTPGGVTLFYRITAGATADAFEKRAREFFGVTPVFSLKEGYREAMVPLPLPKTPTTDELVPDAASQRMRVISWFQRQQVMLNISEVPPVPTLPGKNGEPPPHQDWQAYAFSFSGILPASYLFEGMDSTGVRITRTSFELNGSAFNYSTEGQIYASK